MSNLVAAFRAVPTKSTMLQSFEYVVRINLFGTFNVLRLFVEQVMLSESEISESERAIIINVASIAAFEGQANSPYCCDIYSTPHLGAADWAGFLQR